MRSTEPPANNSRYECTRRLGAGGMAEVYLGVARSDCGFEKPVAIKRLPADFGDADSARGALAREAQVSVALVHPNIVRTLDYVREHETELLVMEHLQGCDAQQALDAVRAAGGEISVGLAAYIVASICRGLHHAHEHRDADGKRVGIVHRDVSPQNVLLTLGGEVKIGDFGIAKTDARPSDPAGRVIKGKYAYMSPEQAQAGPVDARSDVFSAGVVLWELLVGERLFQAVDVRGLLQAVREARVPRPSERRREVPEALDAVVLRATRPNPDERYRDARSMADALDAFLRDRGFHGGPTRIRELVQSVDPFLVGTTSPWASLPQTRDRVATRSAPSVATPLEPPLRRSLDPGAATLVGWRPERRHRAAAWLAFALSGGMLVAAVAWWLFGV